MHTFPRDPKRRLEWAVKVNLAGENGKLWVPPKVGSYGLCEAHFEEDQYEPRRPDRKLRPFAVPTIFGHRKQRKKRRVLQRADLPNPKTVLQTLVQVTSNDHSYLAPSERNSEEENKSAPDLANVNVLLEAALARCPLSPVGDSSPVEDAKGVQGSDHEEHADGNTSALRVRSSSTTIEPMRVSSFMVPPASSGAVKQAPTLISTSLPKLTGPGRTVLVPCSGASGIPGGPFVLIGPNLVPVSALPGTSAISAIPLQARAPSPQLPVISSVKSLSTSQLEAYQSIASKPLGYEELLQENDRMKEQMATVKRDLSETTKQLVKLRAALAKQSERLYGFFSLDQIEAINKVGEDVKWKEDTLKYSLGLYCDSPEAYKKLLDKQYPFPPPAALKSYCKKNAITEGVPEDLLDSPEGGEGASDVTVVWL